jgi:hypothetical protein
MLSVLRRATTRCASRTVLVKGSPTSELVVFYRSLSYPYHIVLNLSQYSIRDTPLPALLVLLVDNPPTFM